jgi:hypothetical protein
MSFAFGKGEFATCGVHCPYEDLMHNGLSRKAVYILTLAHPLGCGDVVILCYATCAVGLWPCPIVHFCTSPDHPHVVKESQ